VLLPTLWQTGGFSKSMMPNGMPFRRRLTIPLATIPSSAGCFDADRPGRNEPSKPVVAARAAFASPSPRRFRLRRSVSRRMAEAARTGERTGGRVPHVRDSRQQPSGGYYSVAASAVLHRVAIGKLRRNMPDPVPIVLLGRLAVDRHWQGRGMGADLLRDAVLRTVAAAESIGIRGLPCMRSPTPPEPSMSITGFARRRLNPGR